MGCQDCQGPRGTGALLGSQGCWGTGVSLGRMGNQEGRVHRVLGAPQGLLGLQGFLADVDLLDQRGRQVPKDTQEYLAFGVTRDPVAWLENLDFQVRGDFLAPMDPLDQLGPRVSQVSQVALGDQGQQEPLGRRVTWGSLGSLACGAPQESQDSRVQLAL